MKKNAGFTLIELMIVVAIIAIIAAIAIPSLLRSRMQSNESSAIGNLRAITGAQVAYHSAHSAYAVDLAALGDATQGPQFLMGDWTVAKSGYTFGGAGGGVSFTATATPESQDVTGYRHFFVDETGVIRANGGAAADATSTPIGET